MIVLHKFWTGDRRGAFSTCSSVVERMTCNQPIIDDRRYIMRSLVRSRARAAFCICEMSDDIDICRYKTHILRETSGHTTSENIGETSLVDRCDKHIFPISDRFVVLVAMHRRTTKNITEYSSTTLQSSQHWSYMDVVAWMLLLAYTRTCGTQCRCCWHMRPQKWDESFVMIIACLVRRTKYTSNYKRAEYHP